MTPQQANELLPCAHCDGMANTTRLNGDERDGYSLRVKIACATCGANLGASGDTSKGGYADNSTVEARAIAAWNHRASAPTEPAVDRDAWVRTKDGLPIPESYARRLYEGWRAMSGIERSFDEFIAKYGYFLSFDSIIACWAHPKGGPAIRAALATPASPAVPAVPAERTQAQIDLAYAALSQVPIGAPALPGDPVGDFQADARQAKLDGMVAGWTAAEQVVPERAPLAPNSDAVAWRRPGFEPEFTADSLIGAYWQRKGSTVTPLYEHPAPQVAQASQWKWPRFEDWLASPIVPPVNQVEYVRLAFNAGREHASQPTSAEELQQKEHIPPSRAEPASQPDACFPVLTDERITEISRAFRNASGLVLMDLSFARAIEAELTGRCRAQGGITNHSTGLPTSAEGKDSPKPMMELTADGWDFLDDIDPDWLITLPRGTTLYLLPDRASTGKDTDKEAK